MPGQNQVQAYDKRTKRTAAEKWENKNYYATFVNYICTYIHTYIYTCTHTCICSRKGSITPVLKWVQKAHDTW